MRISDWSSDVCSSDLLGRVVVLAQVLWVKGNSTASGDAKRVYLTLEREFDVQELEFFAKNEFDARRFKHDLPDAKVHTEFSAYQERLDRKSTRLNSSH